MMSPLTQCTFLNFNPCSTQCYPLYIAMLHIDFVIDNLAAAKQALQAHCACQLGSDMACESCWPNEATGCSMGPLGCQGIGHVLGSPMFSKHEQVRLPSENLSLLQ